MAIFRKKNTTQNRRSETRYCLPNLAAYTDEGAEYREKLVNVSFSGCCLSTPVKLKNGDHVLIHFITSPNYYTIDDSFCLDGSVVWSASRGDGNFTYGFVFPQPHTTFFIDETRAFREQLARMACQQYGVSSTCPH